LSQLDKALLDSEGVSFLRVWFGPLTKSGKYPSANFQNLRLDRTGKSDLTLTVKDRSGDISISESTDGFHRFHVEGRGRVFDPKLLARALCKIGLGVLAHDHGTEAALDGRFDFTRDFVAGRTQGPRALIMKTRVTPEPQLRVGYQRLAAGTPVVFSAFGVVMMVNLEERPEVQCPPELQALGFEKFTWGAE
jgi:hypothetical protein